MSDRCPLGYLFYLFTSIHLYMNLVIRKAAFCICENKDADQLRGNREADQRLCFRYTDSTIALLPKFQASSHILWLYSPVCVGPGQKPRKPVFSERGSYTRCQVSVLHDLCLLYLTCYKTSVYFYLGYLYGSSGTYALTFLTAGMYMYQSYDMFSTDK